jgi:hypothetical protein
MSDWDATRLLFGPYRPPRCRLGRVLNCAVRSVVIVCGMTDARSPWPPSGEVVFDLQSR